MTSKKLINSYIEQLDHLEKIAYDIAREHLESSFTIEKSIGFKQWKEENDK